MYVKNFKVFLRGFKPLISYKKKYLIVYRKGELHLYNFDAKYIKTICKLPTSNTKIILSKFRLLERILRLEPRKVIFFNENQILLIFDKRIYKINIETSEVKLDYELPTQSGNPLDIRNIENIQGFNDGFVFGEYNNNKNRNEISIFFRGKKENDKWSIVYTFPKNTIRHIHSIIPDPFRNCLIILTGDDSIESGIWIAKNHFSQVYPLVIGKQIYRSCVAFPLQNQIVYATDTPFEENFICALYEENNTWKTKKIIGINGSCIYGLKFNDKLIFSTAVEPDSRINRFLYLFTNKIGPGIKNKKVQIIIGNIEKGFLSTILFEKDWAPMVLCQFGTIQFAQLFGYENKLFMYPVSVKKYENMILSIEI